MEPSQRMIEVLAVDVLWFYVNLIRISLVILTVVQLFRRDYQKITPAIIVIGLTFLPWLLGFMDFQINPITGFLYPTVVCMAVYWGSGWKFYDRFSWWDRLIHCLSGILFFSVGVTLAENTSGTGLASILIFSAALSLALHVIWEVLEYLSDCFFRTNHQRWQKNSLNTNHQPERAIQPPGLVDTMNDMIACIIGTVVACAGWWIALSI